MLGAKVIVWIVLARPVTVRIANVPAELPCNTFTWLLVRAFMIKPVPDPL